jgi:hypothetical protein
VTPDQVVAARWTLARRSLNWTQEQAVQELARVGIDWSAPTLSNVERSVNGKRVKEFSASEVVALSKATGYPVSWFFVPLGPDPFGLMPRIVPRESKLAASPDELVQSVIGRLPDATEEALAEVWASLSSATRAQLRSAYRARSQYGPIRIIDDEPKGVT